MCEYFIISSLQFDIILDEDLIEFEKAGIMSYFPIVQNPDENWRLGEGRVSEKMMESFMPPVGKNMLKSDFFELQMMSQ